MIRSILHPNDLTVGNEAAFLHGLRLAVGAKCEFSILHSAPLRENEDASWQSFPGVRSALVRWGLIDADAPQSAVDSKLGVRIRKAEIQDTTPVNGVMRWLQNHSCDLIVMETHAREGAARLLKGSIAANLANHARLPTLFLPISSSGFVDPATGTALIRNVLIPVDRAPRPAAAISMAFEVAKSYDCPDATIHLLHIGTSDSAPTISVDAAYDRRLRQHTREGAVTDAIVAFARELGPELIVMPTLGRHGFLDALRGSTTERVLRQAQRPLLAVPEG
jgi:nucleotide-binding universal stress UspA family protein